ELREELGIVAEVGSELWRTRHDYPGCAPVEVHFLEVVTFDGDLCGDDHFAEVRWQALDRLADLDFLEADDEVLAHLTQRGALIRGVTVGGRISSAPPRAADPASGLDAFASARWGRGRRLWRRARHRFSVNGD